MLLLFVFHCNVLLFKNNIYVYILPNKCFSISQTENYEICVQHLDDILNQSSETVKEAIYSVLDIVLKEISERQKIQNKIKPAHSIILDAISGIFLSSTNEDFRTTCLSTMKGDDSQELLINTEKALLEVTYNHILPSRTCKQRKISKKDGDGFPDTVQSNTFADRTMFEVVCSAQKKGYMKRPRKASKENQIFKRKCQQFFYQDKEELTSGDAIAWAAYHFSIQPMVEDPPAIYAMLPLFYEKSATLAMIKHGFGNGLTLGEKVYVVMLGDLHTEMALWNTLGDLLEGSGWTAALTTAEVVSSGMPDSFLKAAHLTRTRHAHQVTVLALQNLQKEAFMLSTGPKDDEAAEAWRMTCCQKVQLSCSGT
ncbi:uncharacterized protein LOC127526576 [Erpetoichthys calabaricus]|uniref:uncharacterized protein LOC127526576 n=1 Tax=Erpetoichthys calabaricus TaxID=27687 RepID=UPI0022346A6C|nr:uncharacterized protein LOC127526576 [Erpetoichthys calabaricus]